MVTDTDRLDPLPAPEFFEGLLLRVPLGITPAGETNIMQIIDADWIEGDLIYHAIAVSGNHWEAWFPLATAAHYVTDYLDAEVL